LIRVAVSHEMSPCGDTISRSGIVRIQRRVPKTMSTQNAFPFPYARRDSSRVRLLTPLVAREKLPSMRLRWPRGRTGLLLWCCSIALAGLGCAGVTRSDGLSFPAPEPSGTEPVTAAMKADRDTVRAGESFEILVRVRIAGGHHIYSTNALNGPFTPTTLDLILPAELKPVGKWVAPKPTTTKTGNLIYSESILFRRSLKVLLNTPPGLLSIKGALRCQACTEELCWPPGKIGVSTTVAVVSKTKE